ncbi:hypothetical protein [Leptolyngbya sp. 7M]|uniref:hypothetical protein n=1 Tax=Leptolyngbya sp. 7M TaxID=2812896 RepID=UPI001B8B8B71|nr:hypothetical protein [Leptolyngbya sp. 7M]QYO64179.1 hypothetical protein JVX88_31265 [Leptolyngbya sp. 7M]
MTLSASYEQTNVGVSNPLQVSISSSVVLTLPMMGQFIGFSPDGSQIIISSWEIDLISTATYQVVKTINPFGDSFGGVIATFDSTGTQIYSVVINPYPTSGYVDSYDVSSGKRLLQSSFTNAVNLMKGSAPGSPLVVATGDPVGRQISAIGVLDPSTMNWVHSAQFPNPKSFLFSFAANPQGDLIILWAGGRTYSYQPQTNTLLQLSISAAVLSIAFHSDGKHWLFPDESEPTIHVVDSASNQLIGEITLPTVVNFSRHGVNAYASYLSSVLVVAPDGVNCFAVLSDNTIAWFRFDQMKFISIIPGPATPIAIAVDPASQYLYVIDTTSESSNSNFVLWKIPVPTL